MTPYNSQVRVMQTPYITELWEALQTHTHTQPHIYTHARTHTHTHTCTHTQTFRCLLCNNSHFSWHGVGFSPGCLSCTVWSSQWCCQTLYYGPETVCKQWQHHHVVDLLKHNTNNTVFNIISDECWVLHFLLLSMRLLSMGTNLRPWLCMKKPGILSFFDKIRFQQNW